MLARFFFLKTTFAILLVALLTIGGVMAYFALVKESLPDLDIPQATITTTWPGADPQTMEKQVTDKIETELTGLQGLKAINSASFDSFSLISVEFLASTDSREAMTRLRAKLADAEAKLPADAEKPTMQQVSVDDRPVLSISLFGEGSASALSDLGRELQERLEAVPGVSEVDLGGARKEVVQIRLRPERLLALGLAPTTVRDAIQRANIEQPFGEIQSEVIGAVVRLEGRFRTLDDLRALPVTRFQDRSSGVPVSLGEVAIVERGLEKAVTLASYSANGGPFRASIDVSIKKSPGADTIKLIDAVKREIVDFKSTSAWPQAIDYRIVQNEADQIWDSLINVFNNGWQAMLAVFLILFVVLSWREGLIAGLAVPVTFAGALIAVLVMGYSLNELVIIGMVLALGLLVDVFILMMEGLHEEIHAKGSSFGQAALATVRRYGMPAFAGQLTTIFALAPLMAIGGTSGKFIRVLPATAIACLVIAFIVALLAAVPLARFVLAGVAASGSGHKKNRADRITEQASAWHERFLSRRVLRGKATAWLFVGAAVLAFAGSIAAISTSSLVLYPKADGKKLGINVQLPPSTRLESSAAVAERIGEMLRAKPYFASVVKLVGRKSPYASGSVAASLQPSEAENFLGFSATFKDRDQRDSDGYVLADSLRSEIAAYLRDNVAGAELLVVAETGQPTGGDPIEIELRGSDFDVLLRLSAQVEDLIRRTRGTADVRNNLGTVKAEIALRPKREALDFHGLSNGDLASQVRIALSNDKIGSFARGGGKDDLDIRLGTAWPSRDGQSGGPTQVEELARVRAFTGSGESVAMLSLIDPVQSEAPSSIVHAGGKRALTVLSKTQDRAVTEIMAELQPKLDALQKQWPAGYAYRVGGESAETGETFASAGIALVIALVMVFGVLVIVFDSFSQAFILITTVPFALTGTFLAFPALGMPFSFFAMVGVIALIGICVNNGIVMVDTMNEHLAAGEEIHVASAKGAAERLRPILTTSVTTIVGLVPLAIGSPMYRPLCLAIIFGLFSATLISLFVIPALYLLLTPQGRRTAASLD